MGLPRHYRQRYVWTAAGPVQWLNSTAVQGSKSKRLLYFHIFLPCV